MTSSASRVLADQPAWPRQLYDTLKRHRVGQIAYVPDAGHKELIERAHADSEIRATVLTTEEEGVALASGVGSATYDVAAAEDHPRNFYLWGAMGGSVAIGLGLALAQPATPVAVITGDGDMLMGMGSLATVATQNPGNLSIVVLDNGVYGETGMQRSHTALGADLVLIARGCGIGQASRAASMGEVLEIPAALKRLDGGARFFLIPVKADEQPKVLPARDGVYLKNRFRSEFGLAPL
jgi:thiamine pyrophosphate-dependent acetolactate synthase large subunit-like protein